jgi:DNA polymerase III sliding clamp (beta) subunit (PCNA family)
MFKLQTKASSFKESFYLFQTVDTINVDISPKGFEFSTIDPGRTYVTSTKIPNDFFDSFECESGNIIWNLSSIKEFLRYVRPNEIIKLEWHKKSNILNFQSKLIEGKNRMEIRNYSPPIDIDSLENYKDPSKFKIQTKELYKVAAICGGATKLIKFELRSKYVSVNSYPFFTVKVKPKEINITDFEEYHLGSTTLFNVGPNFSLILESISAPEIEITLEYDKPMKIVAYNSETGIIVTYYIAPYIEQEQRRYR